MARASRRDRPPADEGTRRITAPIPADLFRRVGAYASYADRDLGDIATEAFTAFLAAKRFRVGQAAGDDEQAA